MASARHVGLSENRTLPDPLSVSVDDPTGTNPLKYIYGGSALPGDVIRLSGDLAISSDMEVRLRISPIVDGDIQWGDSGERGPWLNGNAPDQSLEYVLPADAEGFEAMLDLPNRGGDRRVGRATLKNWRISKNGQTVAGTPLPSNNGGAITAGGNTLYYVGGGLVVLGGLWYLTK